MPALATTDLAPVIWGATRYDSREFIGPFISAASGLNHSVALKADGTVVAWGYDYSEQSIPKPAQLTGVTAVSAGSWHSLALKSDGTVVAWGFNGSHQCDVPAGLTGVVAIAAGEHHNLALKSDGTVVAWGANSWKMSTVPAGLSGVVAVAVSSSASFALKNDGTITAWGYSFDGETNVGWLTDVKAIDAGEHSLVALKKDGTVVMLGSHSDGSPPAGLNGVVAVASGLYFHLALKADGTVVAWGSDRYGVVTKMPAGLDDVVSIDARSNALAVKSDGSLIAWGENTNSQSLMLENAGNLRAIALGENHIAALKDDGTVIAWGKQEYYEDYGARVPAGLVGVAAIRVGYRHTLALKQDGTITAWGNNELGQVTVPAGLAGVTAIAAGGWHNVALKADGTVVCWGNNQSQQCQVPGGLSGVVGVAAGYYHTVALKEDGTVVVWGYPGDGAAHVPPGLTGVVAIACGESHTVALKNDGTVTAWGRNNLGQSVVPAGLQHVAAIAAGKYHSAALKTDGTVVVWGNNVENQALVPAGLGGIRSLAAGGFRMAALIPNPSIPSGSQPDIAVFDGGGQTAPAIADGQSAAMAFGSAPLNTPVSRTFRITNQGQVELAGIGLTIDGPNPECFTITQTPAASVSEGADTLLTISFSTATASGKKATLHIASNDPDEFSFDISLTGTGVNTPIVIAEEPESQIVPQGSLVQFKVQARAQASLSYQWRKGTAKISKATAQTHTIAHASLAAAGTYSVQAFNAAGSKASADAELSVVNATTAKNVVTGTGTSVTFSIDAVGRGLTYQWWKGSGTVSDSNRIRGAKSKSLTIKALETTDEDAYVCEVTAPGGSLRGGTNTLIIFSAPPVVSTPDGDPEEAIVMPNGIIGKVYEYIIPVTAGNAQIPTSYSATGLPTGLAISTTTGLISGTPAASKSEPYRITLTASNSKGKSAATALLRVLPLPEGTAGAYVARINRDGSPNGDLSDLGGRLEFTVQKSASFTGKLQLGGTSYLLKGVLTTDFTSAPTAAVSIARKGLPPVEMALLFDPETGLIEGTVTDGGGDAPAVLAGWRNVWSASQPAVSRQGRHVFGLAIPQAQINNEEIPQGIGFGTVVIAKTGTATVAATLADGSSVTSTAPLSPNGQVLVFSPLYLSTGSVVGSLALASDPSHTVTGALDWLKQFQPKETERSYRPGFGPLELTASGGLYVPPAKNTIILELPDQLANASLRFNAGGIEDANRDPDTVFRITNTHSVVLPKSGTVKLTFGLSTTTGAFSGTFQLHDTLSGATKDLVRSVRYQGMVIPAAGNAARGFGYFLLPQLPSANASSNATKILSGRVVLGSN